MRVIAGRFRGRLLRSLEGTATRPMLGRLRQRLFDILQGQIAGKTFADLYAGTGSVGIEALSRGAKRVVFVEADATAVAVIRSNLEMLGALGQAHIRRQRVDAALNSVNADIYFLGPPYKAADEYAQSLRILSGHPCELVVAQHSFRLALEDSYGSLVRVRMVKMGKNRLSLYRFRQPPAGP